MSRTGHLQDQCVVSSADVQGLLERWLGLLGTYREPVGFRACCCLSLVHSVLLVPGQSAASTALVWDTAEEPLSAGKLPSAFAALARIGAGQRLKYAL